MAWNDTDEGNDLNNAYEDLVKAYQTTLPNSRQSLDNLSERPISG